MQTASMLHGPAIHERREASHHLGQQHHYYYPQPPSHGQAPPPPYCNPYSATTTAAYPQYQHVEYAYQRAPQSPPSPPVDEAGKPSLPSISSLLHIAGSERMTSDTGSPKQQSSPQQQSDNSSQQQQQQAATSQPSSAAEQQEQPHVQTAPNVSRMTLPPTPPMRPDSVADGVHSPSTVSTQSSFSNHQPYYLGQSLNNLDPNAQRQTAPPFGSAGSVTSAGHGLTKRHSLPASSASPYGSAAGASPYTNSPYGASPNANSARNYYSPETHVYPPTGLYAQRPLPMNFPPPPPSVQIPLSTGAMGPASAPASSNAAHLYQSPHAHQHHHYISASSASTFPQSQDRYICPTCNKAFSRPSSLRIHSHSHTGEKPFKCPHVGCGKAFSVRSNMKRHERGCHAGATPTMI